jgi:hypothetical protein
MAEPQKLRGIGLKARNNGDLQAIAAADDQSCPGV